MNLQRYTLNIGPGESGMVENVYGAWVKYEDAMELLQAHHKAVEAVTELFNFTVNGDAVLGLQARVEQLERLLHLRKNQGNPAYEQQVREALDNPLKPPKP